MSLWTEVKIEVRNPKNENISKVVQEVLDQYKYSETFFKSLYTKEDGVKIELRSTLSAGLILPLLLDLKKRIKSHAYFDIRTYM